MDWFRTVNTGVYKLSEEELRTRFITVPRRTDAKCCFTKKGEEQEIMCGNT